MKRFFRAQSGFCTIPSPPTSKENAPMTSFRLFAVIGSHRRVRTVGLLVATFSVVAALATACGGGGSGSDASANGVAHLGTTTTTSDAGAAAGAGASAGGSANPETIGADLMKFS